MRSARRFLLLGSLCAMFGFGCATQPSDSADESAQDRTSEADQDLIGGGGDGCSAWSGCYSFCRLRFKCTTTAGCDSLGDCLDGCDSSYPSAPGSCPYPG